MRFSDITSIPGYNGKNYINLNRKEVPYAKRFAETFGFLADYVIDAIHYTRKIGFLSRPYKDGSLGYPFLPGTLHLGHKPSEEQQQWMIGIRKDLFSRTFVLTDAAIDRLGSFDASRGDRISVGQALKLIGVWVEHPHLSTDKTRYYGSPYDGSQQPTDDVYTSDAGNSASGSGSGDGGNSGSAGTGTSDGVDQSGNAQQGDGNGAPPPPPPPPPPADPRDWQSDGQQRSTMTLMELIQHARQCADMTEDGPIISTRTVKGITNWLEAGLPLIEVLDRITQSWEPETIAHVWQQVPGISDLVERRRNKQPVTPHGDWTAVERIAEGKGITPNAYWPHVLDCLHMPEQRVWIFVPTGSGKTYGMEQLCECMQWDMSLYACGEGTENYDLIGGIGPQGWQDGPLLDAYENGKTLILDEFSKMSAETTGALNAFLNGNMRITTSRPGNPVAHRHANFRVVICDNSAGNGTDGNYVVNEQSADTVGRFEHLGLQVFAGYDEPVERAILGKWADC